MKKKKISSENVDITMSVTLALNINTELSEEVDKQERGKRRQMPSHMHMDEPIVEIPK